MPFTQPYKGFFTKGDLIYGLAPSRRGLMIHLRGTDLILTKSTQVEYIASTVDHYRGETYQKKIDEFNAAYEAETVGYLPQYNQPQILEAQKRRDKRIEVANEFAADLTGFQNQLGLHAKYGRYIPALQGYGMNEEAFASAVDNVASNSAFRAKSKFGMEWTARKNAGLDANSSTAGVHIHFALDDIDMAAVVTKTHRFEDQSHNVLAEDLPKGKSKKNEDKVRTITHSELRWIYRNRGNPLVQRSIQFWLNQVACGPPWENDTETTTLPTNRRVVSWRTAWTLYKPSLTHNSFD